MAASEVLAAVTRLLEIAEQHMAYGRNDEAYAAILEAMKIARGIQ